MSQNEPTFDPANLDPEALREQAQVMGEIVTHPGFTSILREIQALPEDQRRARAEDLASVEVLQARGVPVPDGFRFTTRVFETPSAGAAAGPEVQAHGEQTAMGFCASVGWIVCASYGN